MYGAGMRDGSNMQMPTAHRSLRTDGTVSGRMDDVFSARFRVDRTGRVDIYLCSMPIFLGKLDLDRTPGSMMKQPEKIVRRQRRGRLSNLKTALET